MSNLTLYVGYHGFFNLGGEVRKKVEGGKKVDLELLRKFMFEMADEVTPIVEPTNEPQTEEPKKEETTTQEGSEETIKPKQGDEPTKTPETSTQEEPNKEIEELKILVKQLTEKLEEKPTLEEKPNEDTEALNQLKVESESYKTKVTEYEAVLNEILNSKLEKVPENFKELVPKNISIKEQLEWLNKAESNGLFEVKKSVGDIEIGKPMNPKNPTQMVDTSKLTAGSLLSMAYGSKK